MACLATTGPESPALLQCPSLAFGPSLSGNLSPSPSMALPSAGSVLHSGSSPSSWARRRGWRRVGEKSTATKEKTVWGGASGSGVEQADCEGLVEVQEAGG